LELNANSLDDRFNSKYTNRDDWMMTAQLSVTYKFGMAKSKKFVDNTPPIISDNTFTQTENVDQGVVAPPTTTTIVRPEPPLKEVVYYAINVSDPKNVDAVAAECARWAKENPSKKLVVTGYADKGTGTAVINQRISEARAKKMVEALKKAGILDSQIVSQGVGDKVQPFTSNDDNRCVIIEGK
jgi:outer membrane protein OmpA-like peptidoglycan-associated protein